MLLVAFLIIPTCLWSVGWPLSPQDQVHPIGNNWGEFQDYSGTPGSSYLHNGTDVMGITSGRPVYAVAKGYVKAWLTIQAELHWRLAIGDARAPDSCNGWLYAHIDTGRFHLNVGDSCNAGDLIGYLVPWPNTGQPVNFHHCHFARIRNAGTTWNSNWLFVQNPVCVFAPNTDTIKPAFENATGTQLFAFCRDNTSTYLSPNSLNGNVDIVVRVYDRTGYTTGYATWDRLIPYKIEYRMRGPVSIPTTRFMIFNGLLNYSNSYCVVIFKDDATCNSRGDYSNRVYYFIITNTDGDSLIETTDVNGRWQTTSYPDGTYWVIVTAYDVYGNYKTDSMQVVVNNYGMVEDRTINLKLEPGISPTLISSHGILNVCLPNETGTPVIMEIFDVSGKKITSINLEKGKSNFIYVPVAGLGLSKGIYFVRIEQNDLNISKKIIVVE